MESFDKLLIEARRANKEEDLPDAILNQIQTIYDNQGRYIDQIDMIDDLTEMLEDFEPFADVGCGNESYSTTDIQRAVDKIIQ
ncbi:MAG: hypothetical protein C0603_02125 [Denitrovibrio sp.]|nr:MAG: hypothetical protein C0603_02125 [Denitrovibrio sp.]